MSNSSVIYPDYLRIVERKPGGWLIKQGTLFYKRLPFKIDWQDFELLYGISKQQMSLELFRINGGKAGYYLADLRHQKYYYCGLEFEAVPIMLQQLGIGRNNPNKG